MSTDIRGPALSPAIEARLWRRPMDEANESFLVSVIASDPTEVRESVPMLTASV